MMKNYIIYHKDCTDGFWAAYIAWKKFGDDGIYIPMFHWDELPKIEEWANVYLLDIAFSREKMISLKNKYNVVVLDHHKSAYDELHDLEYCKFDMNKSWTILAWEYFFPNQNVPTVLKYVEDKDLWKWILPNSKTIYSAISSYDHDFDQWDNMVNKWMDELLFEWHILEKYRDTMITSVLKNVHYIQIDEFTMPAINSQIMVSETVNRMIQEIWLKDWIQVWCCYFVLDNDNIKFSLRSIGDFDILQIAKRFWWGWHKNSGWFILPKEKFNFWKISST